MRSRFIAALASACALAGVASAQQAATIHIRGTIAAFDGHALTVATREGPQVVVDVPATARISALRRVDLSSVAPGTFICTTAKPGPGGELRAVEVHVFPDSARGTGEGHRDWDLAPGATMTNATVTAAVESRAGRDLTLSYKGGSVKVVVPPGTPVVTPVPAGRPDLRPGAVVFATATRGGAGGLTARSVTVAKGGVAPPM